MENSEKKFVGRAPSSEMVAAVEALHGMSYNDYRAWLETLDKGARLVAKADAQAKAAEIRKAAKGPSVSKGAPGKPAGAATVQAVQTLFNMEYADFQNWLKSLEPKERNKHLAKARAGATLISQGISLSVSETA